MSTVYNLEPQPTAKVILHTTSGPLTLELFAQQTPVTSRNFLQLCLDNYYDNTIFHRLVPDFIIQGGDPTGTGSGGESSLPHGAPFADEFHSRLKFNRRGLLGMANTGTKDDNGSQFFLTLGKTEELNGKNTMFGRVEAGNTIFNLVKMGEADLADEQGSERPLYPTRVTGTEVLVNPFEDMVKRMRIATTAAAAAPSKQEKKKPKKKAGKQLLSFGGGDEEEGDADSFIPPIKAAKFNPLLINTVSDQPPPAPSNTTSQKRSAPPPSRTAEPPTKRRLASRSPSTSPPPPLSTRNPPTTSASKPTTQRPTSLSPSPPPTKPTKDQSKPNPLALANAQIAALKASLKRNDLSNTTSTSHETPRSALEAMIPATAIRGRRRKPGTGPGTSTGISMDEQDALDEFKAFRRKLEGVVASSSAAADAGMGVDDDAEMDGSTNLNDDMVTAAISKDKDIKSTTTQTPAQHPNPPSAATGPPNVVVDEDEEALLCDLHFIAYCQSCRKWDLDDLDPQPETQAGNGSDDGGGDTNGTKNGPHSSSTRGGGAGGGGRSQDNGSIFGHQLSFAKDRLGKNLEWKRQNERELVVIDPREKEREIKGERKARREEGRERERVKEGVKRVGQVGGRW